LGICHFIINLEGIDETKFVSPLKETLKEAGFDIGECLVNADYQDTTESLFDKMLPMTKKKVSILFKL
jgi:hypothetical protein